jgi:hypothetical protein
VSKRKKNRKFHAEEVCWSLTMAADLGFSHKEMVEFAWPSLLEWAEFVDWPEEKNV